MVDCGLWIVDCGAWCGALSDALRGALCGALCGAIAVTNNTLHTTKMRDKTNKIIPMFELLVHHSQVSVGLQLCFVCAKRKKEREKVPPILKFGRFLTQVTG
jgi:hypothetical protein